MALLNTEQIIAEIVDIRAALIRGDYQSEMAISDGVVRRLIEGPEWPLVASNGPFPPLLRGLGAGGRYEFREHPSKIRYQQHRVMGSRPRAEATDGVALNGGTIMVGTTNAGLIHGAVAASTAHTVDGVRPTLVSAETTEDGTQVLVMFSEDLSSTDDHNSYELTTDADAPATVTFDQAVVANVPLDLPRRSSIQYRRKRCHKR